MLHECTKVLGVRDVEIATSRWMLYAAALRRRPDVRSLLADPMGRLAVVAAQWAAAPCPDNGNMASLMDKGPFGIEAQHKLDKAWSEARNLVVHPPSPKSKRKPPPKKSKEKKPPKKKKEVSVCVAWHSECCCRCLRRTCSPPSRKPTRTGRSRCLHTSSLPLLLSN